MSHEAVAVEVNQRSLIDKVLARYPEEFTVFRELLQNADDAGAKNFVIDFRTPRHPNACASNGTKRNLDSVKVSEWLVKNDGAPFEEIDWSRLMKIAEGNPDEQKIGAFGVGFYSVFSVTDHPVVKSKEKMMSIFYKDGKDKLYVQKEKYDYDGWTVVELKLKQESSLPRIFELTRFLVTSMTFLVSIQHVTISLDNGVLSTVKRTQLKPDRSIAIPKHMVKTSPERTMSINSVKLIPQEVNVTFVENPLVGALKAPIALVDLEESERKPTESPAFFSKYEEVTSGNGAAPIYRGVTSLKAGAQFWAKYSIYSADVTALAKQDLKEGLESVTKKKPPKDFSFQMIFFTKEEHDKQTQEYNNSGFGSVFRGPQGLCPPLQGEHAARIFIGQSTTQTTGMACHMSGRFIPTVERGSIDLTNDHIAQWNKELLYVGGFLARVAYDLEMKKLHDAWSTSEKTGTGKGLALYTIKSFTFHPSTPDSKVSNIIKDAFFLCSEENDFPLLSDKGIRHTRFIRQYHSDFAPFMQETPVLSDALRAEIISMIKILPQKLRVRPYTFHDVVHELKLRCLTELEMAACLRWWTNTFGSKGPLNDQHTQFRNDLLNSGRAVIRGKEIKLSIIQTFVGISMLNVLNSDDPLPEDTILPSLIQGLDKTRIQDALGWQEMPIAHWLRHLKHTPPDQAHNISRSPEFAFHMLVVLSAHWYGLLKDSRSEIRDILEDVACIPATFSDQPAICRPKETYFPEANIFRDLHVVLPGLDSDLRIVHVLEYLGVQRRCDIETFIARAEGGDEWDAMDLARYLAASLEHVHRVMSLKIFPCSDGERRHIRETFASTDINRHLGLPVVNCNFWDSNCGEGQFLLYCGLREHPTIEELIHIVSSTSNSTRRTHAFAYMCGPVYEVRLEKEFDPSKFNSCAFIPSIRNGKECFITHEEVYSDSSWSILGFGRITDKKIIQKLKIRDRPTAATLIRTLKSNPPKDVQTATTWFEFLSDKGVFSAGDFDKIADLKIIPVPNLTSEQQEWERVSPRECFLKLKSESESESESELEDPFHQLLFRFVDFGPKANAFLRPCGVKERPECIDILKVLLDRPKEFYELAGDHERYMTELRMIAVGYKSLPAPLLEKMRKSPIFLGCRRQSRRGPETQDEYKLCKVEEVLVADDMESCHTFGEYIFIAPQEELLEKFYSNMDVKSLSSCVIYTVNASKEVQDSRSPKADGLRQSIIEKIPIFLHEFDEHRFRPEMDKLRWQDRAQFFVRACKRLHVTKRLDFKHATGLQGREQRDTEMSAEIELKDGTNVLWIEESNADSYDIAAALCRLLFSTYKKNDVLSLMTILDTPKDVLKRRGYDVERILKEYEDRLCRGGQGGKVNGPQVPTEASPVQDGPPASSNPQVPRKLKKLWDRLHKDAKLGEVKPSDIDDSLNKVKDIIKKAGGEDDKHISNREQVGGGKKQKNVAYCDEKRVAENDLEECVNLERTGQIKVWRLRGTISGIPSEDCKAFVNIISNLASAFGVNQTRCHVFYHTSDSSLMGFNRNDCFFFGLEHYIEKHKEGPLGKAYIDWYYIMAHEIAHVHTPYHDEHHELLFAELATRHLTDLHHLPAMQEIFNCTPRRT